MTTQSSLFDDDEPTPPPAATGLALSAGSGAPMSAAARRFNQQLARIDKLKRQLAELDALATTFRPLYHQTLAPLEARHRQLTREMVLWLDQRLQGKGLGARQRQTAVSILCGLAESLAAQGDADMQALHDRHSTLSLDDKDKEAAEGVRAMLENMLGEPLDLGEGEAPTSPEDVLAAGMERLRQAAAEDKARRDEKKARRQARKAPSAAQRAEQAEQEDAESSLRRLYRQLASALHPDREPDAQARARKTALMSEVNAAYERRDLVALMQVQLRAELADAGALARMADDRLAALTRLLKAQVADLERERIARQQALKATFELAAWSQVNARDLQQQLQVRVHELEFELGQMVADLERVRDDAAFKRWLTEQRRLSQAEATGVDFYF